MQQLYQLLLTQQESLPELTYSVVYRHQHGLDGLDNTFTNSTQISDQPNIKCMAISKYSIVFGGDFGVEHWGNNKFNIQMRVQAISFSPDFEYIILSAKETMLFSTKTQNFVKAFPHDVKFDSTGSLCFCKGIVYETATFQQLKQFKCPEYGDFTISTQRDSLYLSSVTLIKHLEDLKDCQLIIDHYDKNKHFEHQIPPSNEVKQLWSNDGTILLIWSQTLDDHTNQSYFGTHHLNHWTEDKLQNIELFEGPIHDVQWVQNGFIVITGYMPAGAILFNKQGEKEYLILQAHINSIFPKNNLVALCGFGNLTGDIYIYEMDSLKKVGQTRQDKVVQFEWSPNGEHFLLATTFPRLRVDNQFIICSKYGDLLRKEKFEELYEIKWVNDNNLNIQINIVEEVKQSKQINLTTGVDFIKQMKEAKVNDQPRKLQKDEKLQTLRSSPQNQQQVQLVQTAVPLKPAPQKQIFMRRQEPIIQQPTAEELEQQHQQHLQQQQMKLEKKQKQKQNRHMNHQNNKQKQKQGPPNDFQYEPNQDVGQNCYPIWQD
ncbi:unnamed protein product (macronuclear) [Paramecium tetraurelia]|uniref:Eukaryotic translation initiation factor 2A n=1 Tax=Paramecium tetraurelia TaxID=5888 RepID=A0DAS5_PARTE|nr:uncharacterized protein GSPATT00015049001 [Paramecium tetraurelia]CAK80142.1 unnamed protein product [Paramecium tetraurelia]|eukprot:XP_001447539.1 hypothetical protein (macronuclear) [Paramecium tetraurelia strain d4-2]